MQMRYLAIFFFLETGKFSGSSDHGLMDCLKRGLKLFYSEALFVSNPLAHSIELKTKRDLSHNTVDLQNYSSLEPLFIDYDYGMMLPRKRAFNPMAEFRKRGHDMHNLNNFFNE